MKVFTKEKSQTYSFMYPPGIIKEVDLVAEWEQVSRSEAMRQLTALGLAQYGKIARQLTPLPKEEE